MPSKRNRSVRSSKAGAAAATQPKQTKMSRSGAAGNEHSVTVHLDSAEPGEYDCSHSHSAVIKVDGKEAGSIDAVVIDRPDRRFYEACDAESGELQAIGCALFRGNGKPRHHALKTPDAEEGGFLYISSLALSAPYRADGATSVGLEAIRQFLALLRGKWTVACYLTEDRTEYPAEERKERREAQQRAFLGGEQWKPSAAFRQSVQAGRVADARQFLRAGFQEVDTDYDSLETGLLYATASMAARPPLSHAEALQVQLKEKQEAPGLTAVDQEIMRTVMHHGRPFSSYRGFDAGKLYVELEALMARGGSLDRAHALHCAVANAMPAAVLTWICKHGADVNALDTTGSTPLMVAAQTALGRLTINNRVPDCTQVQALVALGADRSVTDARGRTALGHYYIATRGQRDFARTLLAGVPREETKIADVGPSLEAWLRPPGGPTAVDLEALEEDEDEDEDEDYDEEEKCRNM